MNRSVHSLHQCKKNGVATLMHLPKGHVWKLEPLLTYKNAPRQSVCIATFVSRNHSWVSLCFFNRTIPKQISEVFSVKCDIKANASATQDFSPKPIAKIKRKNDSTKKKCKKFGFLHFGVNYKCGLLYPTN